MGRRAVLITGGVLVAAVAMCLVAAVGVGSGFTGGCQSGPMELDALMASDSVVGVTRHDAFADRPGLKIWAPGSVAEAAVVWGVAGDRNGLTTSGGRFNIIPEGEDGCATQQVGTNWYEIVWREGDGPHLLVTVNGGSDESKLTERFGQPFEDPVGGVDRLLASVALWAGPAVTIAVLVIIGTIGWVLFDRRRRTSAEKRTENTSR